MEFDSSQMAKLYKIQSIVQFIDDPKTIKSL